MMASGSTVQRPTSRLGATVRQSPQFLLKAHRPDLFGDRGHAAAPGLPFDLVKRMAAAEERLAEREKKSGIAKKPASSAAS